MHYDSAHVKTILCALFPAVLPHGERFFSCVETQGEMILDNWTREPDHGLPSGSTTTLRNLITVKSSNLFIESYETQKNHYRSMDNNLAPNTLCWQTFLCSLAAIQLKTTPPGGPSGFRSPCCCHADTPAGGASTGTHHLLLVCG